MEQTIKDGSRNAPIIFLCRINDEQKVDLAALDLKGLAEVWFSSYVTGRKNIIWEEFIVDVCSRFRDALGSKEVEDFN